MMRPKMEQLLEYVRGGEEDPKIADMLKYDPDGEAKLREARFICGMLGKQSTAEPDHSAGMLSEDLAPMLDMEVAARRASEPRRKERVSLRLVEPPDGRDQIPDIMRSVGSYGPPGGDLGTVFATEKDQVYLLSHRRPRSAEKDRGSELAVSDGQISIDWSDLRIWFSQSIVPDRSLKVRVTDTKNDSPVRGVDIVFMPVSGPFLRTRTNERGVAKLVPVQDGILRFARRDIGLLRIERKNRPDS